MGFSYSLNTWLSGAASQRAAAIEWRSHSQLPVDLLRPSGVTAGNVTTSTTCYMPTGPTLHLQLY